MSLVGTRPILPDELEQYELHHRARIAIKPGITGMWQVSGRSDITDFYAGMMTDILHVQRNRLMHLWYCIIKVILEKWIRLQSYKV